MTTTNTNKATAAQVCASAATLNFDRCPQRIVDHLLSVTGCDLHNLSTLTIPYYNTKLYESVLSYSALLASSTNVSNFPMIVNSLHCAPNDDSDTQQNDMDREEDEEMSNEDESENQDEDALRVASGCKAPIPEFVYGLGLTTLVWPPPPQLSAAQLSMEATERELRRRNDFSDQAMLLLKRKSKAIEETNKASNLCSSTVYAMQYATGSPVSNEGQIEYYHEVLLASVDGNEILKSFVTEVLEWQVGRKAATEGLYTAERFSLYRFMSDPQNSTGWWNMEGNKQARPASSVILPQGQIMDILDDVRSFIKNETKQWYIRHGLPQRRSYLFHGPPGTGKTSTVRVIASTFRLNCCSLSTTSANFNNQMLGDAFSNLPSRALLVLEDVDALFTKDRKSSSTNSMTFSAFLNALDGLISTDGIITVMTTNHIEHLDTALLRGGRVDRMFEFGKPTDDQLVSLFKAFYPATTEEVANKFLKAVRAHSEDGTKTSIANLQQLFILQREKSDLECVEMVPSFLKGQYAPNSC